MNKLKTSEIPNLQMLVSVIQNTNFSWAQFVLHSKALYRVFCDQHHHCCISQRADNCKGNRTLPVPWAFLIALTACGCPCHNGPFLCWELFLSVFYHLLLSIHPQLLVWLEDLRRTEDTYQDNSYRHWHRRFKKLCHGLPSFPFTVVWKSK